MVYVSISLCATVKPWPKGTRSGDNVQVRRPVNVFAVADSSSSLFMTR